MLFKTLTFPSGKSLAPGPRVLPKEVVSWLVAVVPLRGGFPPPFHLPFLPQTLVPGRAGP